MGGFINTPGNELFPTFYEGDLYFSSNGHEGLGGLDIFKFSFDNEPYPVPKNLGRPINSEQDDLGFSIRDKKGYFSSNRYGSDDIFSYNYQKVKVSVNGVLTIDGVKKSGISVKIISKGEDGIKAGTIIDSVLTAEDGSYVFNVRPNRNYQILIEDGRGNKSKHDITASDYINQNYLSQNMNSNKVGGNDKNISSTNSGVNQQVNNGTSNQNKAGGEDKNVSSVINGVNQQGKSSELNSNQQGGEGKNISSTNNGVNQQGNNGGNNLDKPSGDSTSISSTNPSGNLNNYNKDIGLINFVTPKPSITPPVEKPIAAKRTFISVVDSLQSVTKDYLLVHHEFDKVKIYKEYHEAYRDLVDRVRKLRGVKIVIVSATDCLGTDAYNEALSARRSHKIKVDLSRKGGNEIISIPVGEKQLVMECSATDKDKKKQVENRYSYVFIIK